MAEQDTTARLEALENLVAKQAETIETQNQKIEALEAESTTTKTAKKEAKPKPTIPETTFKVDKVEYRFKVAAFRERTLEGWKEFTAEEAMKEKEVLEHLVESKRWSTIEKV